MIQIIGREWVQTSPLSTEKMAQESNIKKELPKEDLRVIIKGELQKFWDKHYGTNYSDCYVGTTYPKYTFKDIYRLMWVKGRFLLNIVKHFKRNFTFVSSCGFRDEIDDMYAMIKMLYRISPTMTIKWNGCIIKMD